MGPPGAGKGTQADLISQRCEIPKYATGDILREAVRDGTPVGKQAKSYMDRGELVPDSVVLGVVHDVLGSPAAEAGFLLDGFPRTLAQAKALEVALEELGRQLDAVVHLDVEGGELIRRLAGRRICGKCGATYNVYTNPPADTDRCDQCGASLGVREDDKEETVRNRLRVYRERTEPLLDWYQEGSVPLHTVEAIGSVEEVNQRLLSLLRCC